MLYLLALAVFAMGTSEFMLAGLLPDIATDLHVTTGAAGWRGFLTRKGKAHRCVANSRCCAGRCCSQRW